VLCAHTSAGKNQNTQIFFFFCDNDLQIVVLDLLRKNELKCATPSLLLVAHYESQIDLKALTILRIVAIKMIVLEFLLSSL